jgi:hypothetical protein
LIDDQGRHESPDDDDLVVEVSDHRRDVETGPAAALDEVRTVR